MKNWVNILNDLHINVENRCADYKRRKKMAFFKTTPYRKTIRIPYLYNVPNKCFNIKRFESSTLQTTCSYNNSIKHWNPLVVSWERKTIVQGKILGVRNRGSSRVCNQIDCLTKIRSVAVVEKNDRFFLHILKITSLYVLAVFFFKFTLPYSLREYFWILITRKSIL